MVNIRKLHILFFAIVFAFFFISINISASTINNIIIVREENMEGNIKFKEMTINSGNYGIKADRTVFNYTIPHDSDKVKLATWTYSNPYGYEKKNLMDIAKDYEEKHPGYIVLGGVNAEGYTASKGGYSTSELTNAFVQDGDVIRKDISYEEFKEMICLNSDKSYSIKRIPSSSDNPYLYIYGENGEVLDHIEISGKNEVSSTGISLLTRDYSGDFNLDGYKVVKGSSELYRITTAFPDPRGAMTGSNLGIFVKGTIDEIYNKTLDSIKDGEFYLVTKDLNLFNKLKVGSNIKIQFDYLDEFGKTESALGYMFKFVENGVNCDENYQFMLEGENRLCAKYGAHDYYKSMAKQRVGIGFKDNGDIVLMSAFTNTGGPSQYEMGDYFLNEGCNNAYQFDGGGSVTFIKRNKSGGFDMLNQPADGAPRSILSGLFIVMEVADIRVRLTEVGSDYVKLDRDIYSDGGSDVSKLYLRIGNKSYNFNKEITIKDLDSFTEYNYELLDAKNTRLNISGSFKTVKKDIVIKSLKINKSDYEYTYNIEFDDIDEAIYKIMISVDGKSFKSFQNGVAIIKEEDLCCLNSIEIEAILRLDGRTNSNKTYKDFKILYGIEEMFDSSLNNLKSIVSGMVN